jgi:hypothetical protein
MELDVGRLLKAVPQNPSRSTESGEDTYFELLAALDADWQIEPPVYVRPRLGSAHAGQEIYHFILRWRQSLRMISVPDSPGLRVFLEEHQIAISGN